MMNALSVFMFVYVLNELKWWDTVMMNDHNNNIKTVFIPPYHVTSFDLCLFSAVLQTHSGSTTHICLCGTRAGVMA